MPGCFSSPYLLASERQGQFRLSFPDNLSGKMQFVGGASESLRGESVLRGGRGYLSPGLSADITTKRRKRGEILLDTRRRRRRRSAKYLSQPLWLKRPCLNHPPPPVFSQKKNKVVTGRKSLLLLSFLHFHFRDSFS